ncbi:hypothetical protein FZEAL_1490 [Fusarium zealandicum]|uniref:Uncharacterized protein n=1 Tax=Fusarium zealandicum TaxID=1053134 RepID=A0A8H4UT49_9HYPO|nr:hypothetical protein FZEAL_1490 [Fusarium zealandicum]
MSPERNLKKRARIDEPDLPAPVPATEESNAEPGSSSRVATTAPAPPLSGLPAFPVASSTALPLDSVIRTPSTINLLARPEARPWPSGASFSQQERHARELDDLVTRMRVEMEDRLIQMRAELRAEMTAGLDSLRAEMTAHLDSLRAEMTARRDPDSVVYNANSPEAGADLNSVMDEDSTTSLQSIDYRLPSTHEVDTQPVDDPRVDDQQVEARPDLSQDSSPKPNSRLDTSEGSQATVHMPRPLGTTVVSLFKYPAREEVVPQVSHKPAGLNPFWFIPICRSARNPDRQHDPRELPFAEKIDEIRPSFELTDRRLDVGGEVGASQNKIAPRLVECCGNIDDSGGSLAGVGGIEAILEHKRTSERGYMSLNQLKDDVGALTKSIKACAAAAADMPEGPRGRELIDGMLGIIREVRTQIEVWDEALKQWKLILKIEKILLGYLDDEI